MKVSIFFFLLSSTPSLFVDNDTDIRQYVYRNDVDDEDEEKTSYINKYIFN